MMRVFTVINPLIIFGILMLVMPHMTGGGSSRDFIYRIPHAWDPANGTSIRTLPT